MAEESDTSALRLLESFTVDLINQGAWSRPTEREDLIGMCLTADLSTAGDAAAAELLVAGHILGDGDMLGLRRDGFDLPSAEELVGRARTGCLFLFKNGTRHTYYGEDPYSPSRPSVETVVGFLRDFGPAL